MHLIRQFVESLALGLGVGLIVVVGAILFLDSDDRAGELGNDPRAVSTPTEEPAPQRDDEGVPVEPDASQVLQGVLVSDERVG